MMLYRNLPGGGGQPSGYGSEMSHVVSAFRCVSTGLLDSWPFRIDVFKSDLRRPLDFSSRLTTILDKSGFGNGRRGEFAAIWYVVG